MACTTGELPQACLGTPQTQDLVRVIVSCIALSYFSLKGKTPSGMFSGQLQASH